MKFDFKQQSVGETAYLVLDLDDDFAVDSFAMNMMTYNRIINIVQTQMVRVNEKRQLQFNVTGLVKMNSRVAVPRSKKEVLEILGSLVNAFEEADAYMMDMNHLLLDWEYVYWDSQGNCVLIYLPFDHEAGKDKIAFLQEVVSRIQLDYQNKDPYLFDILNAFSRGAIRQLSDFREIIKKNASLAKEEEKKEIKAEGSEQKQEGSVLKPPVREEKEFQAKSVSSSKIPVINIPGREPGAKGDRQEQPQKTPQKIQPQNPQIPEKKKGFFQNHFAIPKKKKDEETGIDPKPSDSQKTTLNNVKSDMYEGYEDTVIIQEPAMKYQESDRTVMLEFQEVSIPVSAKLIRKWDGASYTINRERMIIGSGETADIRIQNNTVSRNHAAICYRNGTFYIEDNQSRNGTFLNGRRLPEGKQEELGSRSMLRFSNEDFEFLVESFR